LSNELFIDDLTQLGNRRAFESQFKISINDMQPNDLATLGLVQLHSLQSINTDLGYKAGDDYVCQAALLISEKLNNFIGAKVYRVSGGSFFFTLNSVGQDVVQLCEYINDEFSILNSHYYKEGFGKLVASTYNNNDALGTLLAKLDTFLTQENSATSLGVVYNDNNLQTPYGLREWSTIIDDLVRTNHIEFTFQPVVSTTYDSAVPDLTVINLTGTDSLIENRINNDSINDALIKEDSVLYYELFSQFLNNDEVVANNQLYSMAERTNKSQELDKLVLNKLATLTNISLRSKIAINLTHQSLHSTDFRQWLAHFIKENKSKLPNLVFEINEEAILAGVDSSIHFIQSVKSLGIEICIDRFGASFTSFKYLKGLDVDYLKIDGAYIHELELNHENKHFIQAVTQIGHGVGIKILTSHVETTKTKHLLSDLGCDGLQGNFIQKTLILMEKNTDLGCAYSPIKLT